MRINYISRIAPAMLLVAICAIAASAQVVQISGKVTLRQADGTEVPVKDAIIEIYRTDVAGKYNTKTDSSGRYVHAGIPFSGTYTLVVSAPGASPTFINSVRLSQRPENNFSLQPGDGSKLTLEAARAAGTSGPAAAPTGGGESAESRAKREELAREIAAVETKNKKIGESNEIVARTFKAGNEALTAKRYDDAVRLYDEGIAADAEQPGLLANKSVALRARGVDRFNAAIRLTDDAAKTSGLDAARQDWRAAAEAATKAVNLLKALPPGTDAAQQANQSLNKLAALNARAEALRFVATKGDPSQADTAFSAYQEYIAAETDAAKKSKAQVEAAKLLFDAAAIDRAATEFQKILVSDPENVDATLYAGLSLFGSGDKAKYQEAANYLQRFVDKAPDTHPLKQDAKSTLEFLKTQENVKPEKSQPARRGRGRG